MKAKNTVYYIIVTYNNKNLIDECLTSLRAQTFKNSRIILIDNGSSDGIIKYVKEKYPDVHLINTGSNLGFAAANNIGIRYALEDSSCQYIALINSDATLDKNWTQILVNFAKDKKDGACFQTPTLDYYSHSILDSRGIKVDFQGRAIQLGYREPYKQRDSHVVFGVNAAACLIKSEFLREQPFDDFFDEDMWMYIEDVDFAARSVMMGWKNWYVDGAFAYHMGSASSGKNPGFSVYYSYRNNLSMIIKNLPLVYIPLILFGAAWTDAVTLYKLVRGRNKVAIKAILKGRLASIKEIPVFIKKRGTLLSKRDVSNQELTALMTAK